MGAILSPVLYTETNMDMVTGLLVEVRETSDENFFVGVIRVGDEDHKFAGGDVYLELGYEATLSGTWSHHPKWGKQFKVKSVHYDTLEVSVAGLEILLKRLGEAKGIGPKRAKKVVETWGVRFGDVLEERPEEVAEVLGMRLEYVRDLASYWRQHRAVLTGYAGLLAWGLDMRQCRKVVEKWGFGAVALVRDDPFRLTEVEGIGFTTADAVASVLGVAKDDVGRVRAGVLYGFEEDVTGKGSTCCTWGELAGASAKRLGLRDSVDVVEKGIWDLVEAGKLEPEGKFFTTPEMRVMERDIAAFVKRMWAVNPWVEESEIEGLVNRHYRGLDRDEGQIDAVRLGLKHQGVVICGSAGSGKSTLMRVLIQCFKEKGKRVRLCAPTGKAAKRLEQVSGVEAQTIHRMLGFNPQTGWGYANGDFPADVVVMDESSMCGVALMWRVVKALPKSCCLVLVGDHHQLPPVEPGAVLRDCTEHRLMPMKVLETSHRQAGVLKTNCTAVLKGVVGDTTKPMWLVGDSYDDAEAAARQIVELYTQFVPKRYGVDVQRDCQVIVPMRKDNPLGTGRLNVMLQRAWQMGQGREVPTWTGKPGYVVGDRVIMTKNNYGLDVMNGHQGIVVNAPKNGFSGPGLVVRWEDKDEPLEVPPEKIGDVELSYAITAHKFQGSEVKVVIAGIHSCNWYMLTRGLMYTICTRAREALLIVGDKKGIREAARKVDESKRQTLLPILAGGM